MASWAIVMKRAASRIIYIGVVAAVALALANLAFGGEIHEAVRRGDVGRVKALIKDNPGVVFSKDDTGWTALHLAAQKGFNDIAELLVANKAEVDARSKRGDTPLHWAAGNGHKEVVELLLASNADVNAQDNGGWTALHMAARPGYQEVLQVLLANKAKVNLKDNYGITPRKRAMLQGQQGAAELLWVHGGRELLAIYFVSYFALVSLTLIVKPNEQAYDLLRIVGVRGRR